MKEGRDMLGKKLKGEKNETKWRIKKNYENKNKVTAKNDEHCEAPLARGFLNTIIIYMYIYMYIVYWHCMYILYRYMYVSHARRMDFVPSSKTSWRWNTLVRCHTVFHLLSFSHFFIFFFFSDFLLWLMLLLIFTL